MFIQTAWAAADKASEEPSAWEIGGLYIGAVALFFLSFIIAAVLKRIIMARIRKNANFSMHEEVLLLIDRSIYFGIMLIMIVISFRLVGIDLTWILGAMSFGLGFAFKDILANFIGGIVILTQHKLKIGDLIKVGEKIGRITTIDSRTTQIKALDGTAVIIPNSDMVTDVVQNFTAHEFRRISLEVGVHYSTPLDQAVGVTLAAVKKNEAVIAEPKSEVLCKEFAESAILLEVRFWIESSEDWWTVKSQIIQQIKADFDAAGITIPFPIRTISLDPHDNNLKTALHLPH